MNQDIVNLLGDDGNVAKMLNSVQRGDQKPKLKKVCKFRRKIKFHNITKLNLSQIKRQRTKKKK